MMREWPELVDSLLNGYKHHPEIDSIDTAKCRKSKQWKCKKKISSSTTLEHWLVRCTSMSSNYLVIIARWKTLTDTKNYAEWRSTNCWCSTKIDVRIKTKRLQFNDFTIRCKLIKNPESKSKFYGCALIVFVHIRRFYWTLLRAPK